MNLTDHLTTAIETETNILPFTLPDHAAKQERLAALHHEAIAKRTASISQAKASLRRTVNTLEAEIARLQGEITTAKTGAEALIATDQRIIAASKAFIDVLEGSDG